MSVARSSSSLAPAWEKEHLDGSSLQLIRTNGWGPVLIVPDECCWLTVRVVRAFPLSEPDGEVAFLNRKGEEIGLVPSLSSLPPSVREIAAEELRKRYLVNYIERIDSIRIEGETLYWEVGTHRGAREFVMRASRESAVWLGERRLLLIDVDGSRFEIPDTDRLDAKSRAVLDQVL